MDNATLDSQGLDEYHKTQYWQQLAAQKAMSLAHNERQDIKTAYVQAVADLNTIISTSNPTNAQIVWAVKRLAEIQKSLLRFLKTDVDA